MTAITGTSADSKTPGESPHMINDYTIRRAGIAVCVLSVFTTTTLLLTVISIWQRANTFQSDAMGRSNSFSKKSQVIWAEMSEMNRAFRIPRDYGASAAEELKKGVLHKCSQCTRLHCPPGQAGKEGPSGNDGEPGAPGKPGAPGRDGEDIELNQQPDLPCSICPAGPPGSRGPQGERGMSGRPGTSGLSGHPGKPGNAGLVGVPGFTGHPGAAGDRGVRGPPGDNAIAGEGVKGPRGVPGSQGAKGPPGTAGRPSNVRGAPGVTGPRGGIGKTGKYGPYGERGNAGPPGEPGMPSTYCPSDCGVNTIISGGMSDADFQPQAPSAGYDQQPSPQPQESFDELSYHNFYKE